VFLIKRDVQKSCPINSIDYYTTGYTSIKTKFMKILSNINTKPKRQNLLATRREHLFLIRKIIFSRRTRLTGSYARNNSSRETNERNPISGCVQQIKNKDNRKAIIFIRIILITVICNRE
jgi:hypothetical protein